MRIQAKPFLAAVLSLALALSGCIGSQTDSELEANAAPSEVSVVLAAENPGDVAELGFDVDSVHAHDANISLPEGFHELAMQTGHSHLVHEGEAKTVELASSSVPAGTYDQILIRAGEGSVDTEVSGGEDDGHEDGHDHDHGGHDDHGAEDDSGVSIEAADLPLNVSFEVTPDEPTEITFVLDVGESYDGESFSPEFASAEVSQGNETVATETDLETRAGPSDPSLPSDPPAPRIAVFAPNGDQVLKPEFDPEDGEFANSVSSGFPAGEEVEFTATESEAVAKGAALESYEWELGDGSTATGQTTSHAYDDPGVYEVTLTVTDSYDNRDEHTVRVAVVGWTQTVAEASFDEDSEWTDTSADTELNEWQLAEPGHEGSAWHVGLSEDAPDAPEAGYGPTNEPVSLVSPEFEVPDDFALTGYELYVDGYASAGELELLVHVDGEDTRSLALIGDEAEWDRLGGMDVLDDVNGSTLQFEAVFTADVDPLAQGPGYAIDEFTLAGMAEEDLVNHELLGEAAGGGHDGHDHEH